MSGFRLQKVEGQISQIISELIMKGEVKDYRVTSMLSVSSVEVSRDLAYAKVRISGFLEERALDEAVEGLNSAAGYIQSVLGKRLKTRNTPKLSFFPDRGISEGMEITNKLKELTRDEHETGSDSDR
jgi:ribosome-binding factor A